jgi:hypothetical protein
MLIIEITRKGVYGGDGKMIQPGTRFELKKMPPAWKNKARIVGEVQHQEQLVLTGSTHVVGAEDGAPEIPPVPAEVVADNAPPEQADDSELEQLRADYAEVFGERPHGRMKADKLRARIDEKLAESDDAEGMTNADDNSQ